MKKHNPEWSTKKEGGQIISINSESLILWKYDPQFEGCFVFHLSIQNEEETKHRANKL